MLTKIKQLLKGNEEGYEITVIMRNIKDHKKSKIITTEKKVMKVIDTLTHLSKQERELKESLN